MKGRRLKFYHQNILRGLSDVVWQQHKRKPCLSCLIFFFISFCMPQTFLSIQLNAFIYTEWVLEVICGDKCLQSKKGEKSKLWVLKKHKQIPFLKGMLSTNSLAWISAELPLIQNEISPLWDVMKILYLPNVKGTLNFIIFVIILQVSMESIFIKVSIAWVLFPLTLYIHFSSSNPWFEV